MVEKHNKTFEILIIMFLLSVSVVSATRTQSCYGGTFYDLETGDVYDDGNYSCTLRYYDDVTGGNLLYGLNTTITLNKGIGVVCVNDTETINSRQDLYLETWFNGSLVGDERLNISSVHYSYISNMSEDLECFGCVNQTELEDTSGWIINFSKIHSADWTNVTITSSQISDIWNTAWNSTISNLVGLWNSAFNSTLGNFSAFENIYTKTEVDVNFSNYVPYTGASSDVNLGSHMMTTDELTIKASTIQGILWFKNNTGVTRTSMFHDAPTDSFGWGTYNDGGVWDSYLLQYFMKDKSAKYYGNITSTGQVCDSNGCINNSYLSSVDISNYPNKTDNEVVGGNWTFNGRIGIGKSPSYPLDIYSSGLDTYAVSIYKNVTEGVQAPLLFIAEVPLKGAGGGSAPQPVSLLVKVNDLNGSFANTMYGSRTQLDVSSKIHNVNNAFIRYGSSIEITAPSDATGDYLGTGNYYGQYIDVVGSPLFIGSTGTWNYWGLYLNGFTGLDYGTMTINKYGMYLTGFGKGSTEDTAYAIYVDDGVTRLNVTNVTSTLYAEQDMQIDGNSMLYGNFTQYNETGSQFFKRYYNGSHVIEEYNPDPPL